MRKAILKPGKEKALRNHHHWIFSGAIQELPSFEDGDCLRVHASNGEFLGIAYFNKQAKIIGRMIAFEEILPLEAVKKNLERALVLRSFLFPGQETNSYRLVNGEGDLLPGLIVDRYGDYLVVQVSTLGMEKFLPSIVEWLKQKLAPRGIYEKSSLPSRKEEGLREKEGSLAGEIPDEIEILENGLRFNISIKEGQKTGFFLDHREMRQMVRTLSEGKRVLNCFSYTGGFSVYAAKGGAIHVDSVDISKNAMELAAKNIRLNGSSEKAFGFYPADVFQFLRENELNYDLVILDPPAFAKKQKDIVPACRGYKDINRVAMQKMPAGSLLLTSSCSYHVDEELFQKVIFQAAVEARRVVKILSRHRLAADHPINICHPETDYLKSLLLYVDS